MYLLDRSCGIWEERLEFTPIGGNSNPVVASPVGDGLDMLVESSHTDEPFEVSN